MEKRGHFSNNKPIYTQIVEQTERKIVSGALSPGEKLPSVRDLAGELAVNPNTVMRAFFELEVKKLITSHRTIGKTVTEDTELIFKVREELAKNIVKIFFEDMNELGFSRKEILKMIGEE